MMARTSTWRAGQRENKSRGKGWLKGDRLVSQFGRFSVTPFFLSQKAGSKCQLNVDRHERTEIGGVRAVFLTGGGQKTANAAGSQLGQGPTLLETGRVPGPRDSTDGSLEMTTQPSSSNYCNRQSIPPFDYHRSRLHTLFVRLFKRRIGVVHR